MSIYSNRFLEHSGKVSDKWESYLPVYDKIANSIRPRSILEIGVQNGGSLELWSSLFPEASHIIGLDVNPSCSELTFANPVIEVLIADGASQNAYARVTAISQRFDLIVDDGSHVSKDILDALRLFLPTLSPGGIYVVEDLHASYWKSWGGGLVSPDSAINLLKRLIDIQNFEHWANGLSIEEYLNGLFEVDASFLEALRRIERIEFINSVAVIQMTRSDVTALGRRLVVGTSAQVSQEPLDHNGEYISPEPQELDPESRALATSPRATTDLFSKVKSLARQLDDITQERDDLAVQRNALSHERDDLAVQRNALSHERDDLAVQRNALSQERDDLMKERDELSARLLEIFSSRIWQWTSILRRKNL